MLPRRPSVRFHARRPGALHPARRPVAGRASHLAHLARFRPVLAVLLALICAAPQVPAQTARLRAGWQTEYVEFSGLALDGAIIPIPGAPGEFYAVTGSFLAATVHRLDLAVPGAPQVVANGAADLVGSDDVLDAGFGSLGGLAVLPGGELILVDNGDPTSGGPGNRVFIARDLNADGDFLDVVAGVPEVTELIPKATLDALTGSANFSGAAVHVPPAGHAFAGDVFVQTNDGAGAAEVLRITDPTGTPAASIFWSGFDFGGGLASDATSLVVGTAAFPGGGSIVRLTDLDTNGDARGVGEATTLYAGTLAGCAAIALTASGDLAVAAFRPDFTGSEWFVASATVAEAPTSGLYTPVDFLYAGSIAAGDGAAFAPHAGPSGQPIFGAVDGRLAIVRPAADPAVTPLHANYYVTSLAPPDMALPWGGAVAAIPGEPDAFLASAGPFGDLSVWRVTISDPEFPAYRLVADGAADLAGGDGIADSGFGAIAALVALPGGEVVVVDTFSPFSGGPGDRLFLLVDGDADGAFLDPAEVTDLIAPATLVALTGSANFTGAAATLGPDGALYVLTADGADAAEVLRIGDPAGAAASTVFFADGALGGLDYGSGVAWVAGALRAAEVDDSFAPGADRLWRLVDLNANGTALDGGGEATLLTATFDGSTQLAAGPADTLWRTRGFFGSAVEWIAPDSGALVRAVATTTNSFGGLAFLTAGPATFEPATGSTDRLVVQSTDFGFPVEHSFLHLVQPDPVVPVTLSAFAVE